MPVKCSQVRNKLTINEQNQLVTPPSSCIGLRYCILPSVPAFRILSRRAVRERCAHVYRLQSAASDLGAQQGAFVLA